MTYTYIIFYEIQSLRGTGRGTATSIRSAPIINSADLATVMRDIMAQQDPREGVMSLMPTNFILTKTSYE